MSLFIDAHIPYLKASLCTARKIINRPLPRIFWENNVRQPCWVYLLYCVCACECVCVCVVYFFFPLPEISLDMQVVNLLQVFIFKAIYFLFGGDWDHAIHLSSLHQTVWQNDTALAVKGSEFWSWLYPSLGEHHLSQPLRSSFMKGRWYQHKPMVAFHNSSASGPRQVPGRFEQWDMS